MPTLIVQMGHYPRKTGATGTEGEQGMAYSVAQMVVKNPRPGWTAKAIIADAADSAYRGDAFVAVHGDGSTSTSAGGASVGYRNGQGETLAQAWKSAYKKNGWPFAFRADNYTAALAGYYGVRKAVEAGNKRAIIIEVGFMTNPKERDWINKSHAAIARSIWDAVAGVQVQPEPEEEDMAAKNKVGIIFVKPERVTEITALLAAKGIRVYFGDADEARITRTNPVGTPQ
jgi:hypothetical protein